MPDRHHLPKLQAGHGTSLPLAISGENDDKPCFLFWFEILHKAPSLFAEFATAYRTLSSLFFRRVCIALSCAPLQYSVRTMNLCKPCTFQKTKLRQLPQRLHASSACASRSICSMSARHFISFNNKAAIRTVWKNPAPTTHRISSDLVSAISFFVSAISRFSSALSTSISL